MSTQTISTITDKVMDGIAEWQNRPFDHVYPVLFVDAIKVKLRDGHAANRPICLVMAVTVEAHRDILGVWAGVGGEGAKHWPAVLTELKNRGVDDVLMLVCDGHMGLPQAVETVWPRAIVQICVIHLLRNSFRHASRQNRGRKRCTMRRKAPLNGYQIAFDLPPCPTGAACHLGSTGGRPPCRGGRPH